MNRTFGAALALALCAATATAAEAQIVPRPVRFGIGAGLTGVTKDLADATDPGFHVTGALDIGVPIVPVGFRVDGSWHALKGRNDGPDVRILSATANATMNLLPLPIVKPYVIGGVGMYNRKADVDGFEASTTVGYNAGLGLRFDLVGFGAFAEARYHYVGEDKSDAGFGKTQFYPMTVGIRF